MRSMPSWSKQCRREIFEHIFANWNFLGYRISRYAATTLIVALSPSHRNIIRFLPRSPIATGNHYGRDEKISKFAQTTGKLWRLRSPFRHFGTRFAESFRMNKSSWMMDPTRSRKMPSCLAIDLVEIRMSYKISSLIWSINYGVVTVLVPHGKGAT